ncbi:MAG: ABC transporter ATP-binding protein [Spirochaetales bacterium]|nr:ABC transporter ATP-binding protein [Spirochaetales bacterium]
MGHEPIRSLELRGITKRFPGILACDHIDLSIGEHSVRALVGENGAGKTTLMNILMGLYQPDEGQILINGEEIRFRSPNDAFDHGIGMVHQHFMLVQNMTVVENVALGMKSSHRPFRLDEAAVRKRILEVSEKHELPVNPDALVWQLSVGEQQRVELVKTLCLGARFLILDEPTSALTPQETDELIELLEKMSGELSIVFISHKLHEVKALSDTVSILRRGRIVFEGRTENHSPAELAALMTGHEVELPRVDSTVVDRSDARGLLSIRELRVRGDRGNLALDGVTLDIAAGEIVGLAGVSGNGQRELAEALNGLRKPESGSITLDGVEMAGSTARRIIDEGMGYIPEDRNTEGIVPSFSVRENLVLKDVGEKAWSSGGFLRLRQIAKNATDLRDRFDIRCPSTDTAAGSLSGGNIQKVILARELARGPKALVSVYPTRGLDMGAEEFIHKQLLARRSEGVAILLISEELEEIMNLSDRIAVIYKGKILRIVPGKSATKRSLGLLMAGVSDE